jgi:hypothetical protein
VRLQIGRGEVKIAVLAGCEFVQLLKAAAAKGYTLPGAHGAKTLPWGDSQSSRACKPGAARHHKLFSKTNEQEAVHGLTVPVNVYPIFEHVSARGICIG